MRLTPRQEQIAGLIAGGLTDKEIARALGIAYGTVRGHVRQMLATTGHERRITFAVAYALDRAGQAPRVVREEAMLQ